MKDAYHFRMDCVAPLDQGKGNLVGRSWQHKEGDSFLPGSVTLPIQEILQIHLVIWVFHEKPPLKAVIYPLSMIEFLFRLLEKCTPVIPLGHFKSTREHIAFSLSFLLRVRDISRAMRPVIAPFTLINEPIILNQAAMPRPETMLPPTVVNCPRFILHEDPVAIREQRVLRKLSRVYTVHEVYIHAE